MACCFGSNTHFIFIRILFCSDDDCHYDFILCILGNIDYCCEGFIQVDSFIVNIFAVFGDLLYTCIVVVILQKWTIHRGIRRKSGSPPRAGQPTDENTSQVVLIDQQKFITLCYKISPILELRCISSLCVYT